MTEDDVLRWLIFTLLPLLITVFTVIGKLSNDKKQSENRLTRIESHVKNHADSIQELKRNDDVIREELKILHEVKAQNQLILKLLEESRIKNKHPP